MFRLKKDRRGVVTVFVTLILLPTVAFTGIMSDLARFKTAQQAASDANQLYASSVLSQYDSVLKEMYGLFALSQDESAVSGYENYALSVFDPAKSIYTGVANQDVHNLTDRVQQLFQSSGGNLLNPYRNMKASASVQTLSNSSLGTSAVLQNQVGDYMKYRVAAQLLELDIFSAVDALENLSGDSKILKKKTEIDDMLEDLNKLYKDLCGQLNANDSFHEGQLNQFNSNMSIYADNIIWYYEQIEDRQSRIDALKESKNKSDKDKIKGWEDEIDGFYDKIKEDAKAADSDISTMKKMYDPYGKNLDELQSTCKKIDKKIGDIQEEIRSMRGQLSGCSSEVQSAMEEQIKEYEALFGYDFTEFADTLAGNQDKIDAMKDDIGSIQFDNGKTFSDYQWAPKDAKPGRISNVPVPSLNWKYAKDVNPSLYNTLKSYFSGGDTSQKSTAESNRSDLNDRTESILKNVFATPDLVVKEIPDAIWNARTYGGSASHGSGSTPSVTDGEEDELAAEMTGDIADQFDGAAAGTGTDLLHKLLMVEYDVGMFSCYSTNVQHEKDPDGSKADISLTGIEKSPDANYLYRSELEYVYSGKQNAADNVSAVRSTVFGIRYVLNFIYTYTDSEINSALNSVAAILSAGNPLIQLAVREALRAALTAAETANDLNKLLNGEEVALYKRKADWVLKPSQFFGSLVSGNSGGEGGGEAGKTKNFNLSYEGYITLLLLIFRDGETLAARTGNLIEMNVNHYRQSPLTSLDYRLADSYTAIQTTVNTTLPMLFMPYVQNVFGQQDDPFSGSFSYSQTRGY